MNMNVTEKKHMSLYIEYLFALRMIGSTLNGVFWNTMTM